MIPRVAQFISQIKMKQNKEYIDLFNNIEHKREFYIARKFAIPYFENLIAKMLDKQILNKAGDAINMFDPKCKDCFHFIFDGKSDLMLAVVRQFALLCHLPNFNEKTGAGKTVLTIVCPESDSLEEIKNLKSRLSTAMFLGNLLKNCENEIIFKDIIEQANPSSFIDIKVQLVSGRNQVQEGGTTFVITEAMLSEIEISEEDMQVDISYAKKVNMIYKIGEAIDNHPPYDFANIDAYQFAIDVFRNKFTKDDIEKEWKKISKDVDSPGKKNAFEIMCSNVFCADCLKLRYQWICQQDNDAINKSIDDLARSEHSRWNVEKLILGYRPLTAKEQYEFWSLTGKEKDNYRKNKRDGKEKAHVDINSYHDLRRTHPHDMKYDYFLMLAAKYILN